MALSVQLVLHFISNYLWKRLFTGIVPVNQEHLTGTVPVNKEHLTGTLSVLGADVPYNREKNRK